MVGLRGPECRRDDAHGGLMRWYLYDGLGSVLGEVAPTGAVVASRQLDVYGKERGTGTGTASSKQAFVGSLGHTTDAETGGLVYMRARYMDTATGRFVSEDKAGDGNNYFVYVGNNPINLSDADGKKGGIPDPNAAVAGFTCTYMCLLMANFAILCAASGSQGSAVMFNIMAVVFAVEAFSLFYDALGGMSTMNTKDKGLALALGAILGGGTGKYAAGALNKVVTSFGANKEAADTLSGGWAGAAVGYAFGQAVTAAAAIYLIDHE